MRQNLGLEEDLRSTDSYSGRVDEPMQTGYTHTVAASWPVVPLTDQPVDSATLPVEPARVRSAVGSDIAPLDMINMDAETIPRMMPYT